MGLPIISPAATDPYLSNPLWSPTLARLNPTNKVCTLNRELGIVIRCLYRKGINNNLKWFIPICSSQGFAPLLSCPGASQGVGGLVGALRVEESGHRLYHRGLRYSTFQQV